MTRTQKPKVQYVYNLSLQQLTVAMIRLLTELVSACAFVARAYTRGSVASARRSVSAPAEALLRPRAGTSALWPMLSNSAQWARVVKVIEGAIDRRRRAVDCHTAARSRLDASEYELRRLREELGAVLQRPAGILTLVSARPTPMAHRRPVALAA
jgi:hypothetical protein